MPNDRDAIERLGKVFFDSYFVVDRERRVESFNEGFVQLLGMRPAERRQIKGTCCYDLLKLEICRDHCIALEALDKGDHVRKEEIHGTTANGREVVLERSAMPLKDEAGRVVGVFVTDRDVTDERRLKTRYLEETESHRNERETLLKIIRDRDEE
ncbi:MAG: PAS domain-containing protein, partial [Deltaproteobacteria bacterium]|nr:PAS domain-containing protein [Deltaproteobacteria bacterium]